MRAPAPGAASAATVPIWRTPLLSVPATQRRRRTGSLPLLAVAGRRRIRRALPALFHDDCDDYAAADYQQSGSEPQQPGHRLDFRFVEHEVGVARHQVLLDLRI